MNQFNGDVASRLAVAIDLVNDALIPEAFPRRSGAFEAHGYRSPEAGADWEDISSMASEHAVLFDTVLDDRDAAVQLLNDRLRDLNVTPQLEHREDGYQLHFHTAIAGFAHGWDAGITAAIAIALSTGEANRIGRCEATHCRQLFLDRGRNAQRRFCSLQCQNRVKSATYRARNVRS